MNPFGWITRQLEQGWFSRLVMLSIIYFAWRLSDWAMAFAGTILAMDGQKDLQGAAMIIGAVGVLPVGILTWGLNAYIQMRPTPKPKPPGAQ